MNLALVVIAYNRPKSLLNLLNSLARADYGNENSLTLIISIDKSYEDSVLTVAKNFQWSYGQKIIIAHVVNLGLKKHVLSCGDLIVKYDGIVMLEDDLIVSPYFMQFVRSSMPFFDFEDNVAGVALYDQKYNEIAACPFEAIQDGFDNYFMQVPCSWGQFFTKKQWLNFKIFYDDFHDDFSTSNLPEYVLGWKNETSWKKYLYEYMLTTNRYFVYPRVGLTTNSGDSGTHYKNKITHLQSSILINRKDYNFSTFENSLSIYDAHLELMEPVHNKYLDELINVEFDINGTKRLNKINSEYLFSSKHCINPIEIYAIDFYPYENNILFKRITEVNSSGVIYFGLTIDFCDTEPNFNRLFYDAKRIFGNMNFYEDQVKNRIDFKVGYLLLKPMRVLKHFFYKLKKNLFVNI